MPPQRSSGEWSLAVRQQASVARLGQLGLRGGDQQELLEEALHSVASTLGVSDVSVLELLPASDEVAGHPAELVARAAVHDGVAFDQAVVSQIRFPAPGTTMAGYTVTQGVAVVSSDLYADHRFTPLAHEYGIVAGAAITAPIGWGEDPWGVLLVYSEPVRAWTDDDVHFVQSMANTVGLAVARQRLEHELRDSSARLELSLGAGGLGAWTWDAEADAIDAAPSTLAIFGVSGGRFGGSVDDFLQLVHPEDRAGLRDDIYAAVRATGEVHTVYRLLRPCGEVRWIESWGHLLREPRQPCRLVGVVADITDRHRAGAQMEALLAALQAALLPPTLPKISGLGLAARYRVAEADIEIGGDFYDVIEMGGGAWAVVVGDVCGRGPDAAALTGLMRHSVRTAVVRETLPSRVLGQTNDAVLDQIDDARFCTAAFLRLEPGEPGEPVQVLASCAGHPRPVLLRAGGRTELVDCAGLLLGVVPSPSLVDVAVTLEPGDSLILYTDGVTEARRGKELFGDDRLLAAARSVAGLDAEGIAAGLDAAVSDYQDDANDDVAIVVVQAEPAPVGRMSQRAAAHGR
ncbi:MAG: putative sensor protein [Acidimicrobiales bacterium]|nr:putative sensor protein [Acidimicrobiales bacterium]